MKQVGIYSPGNLKDVFCETWFQASKVVTKFTSVVELTANTVGFTMTLFLNVGPSDRVQGGEGGVFWSDCGEECGSTNFVTGDAIRRRSKVTAASLAAQIVSRYIDSP